MSLITGDDGAPLSKRHGSSSLHDLRETGYLSMAVLNYLSRLSHAYDEHTLMSFAELAAHFHLEKLSRSSARFDLHQLLHWQKEAVRALSVKEVWDWIGKEIQASIPPEKRDLFIQLVRENALFPADAVKWKDILFGSGLQWQDEQLVVLRKAGKNFFSVAQQAVQKRGTDLKAVLADMKAELAVSGKELFMPIRMALTAEQSGPELLHIVTLLGVDEVMKRFKNAEDLVI